MGTRSTDLDFLVREANEDDARAIVDLFRSAYGPDYVHHEFYDQREIRRMIYDDEALVLVAENARSGRVVGTASVLFRMGADSDLVGEFGRLVVHPDERGRGLGGRLMEERLDRVGSRLHMAFVEVRAPVAPSLNISYHHGFVPVGTLPQKLLFGDQREHAAYLVKYFGDALTLRRNHPRVIPEAHWLAQVALTGVGLTPDAIADEGAAPYPGNGDFDVEGAVSGRILVAAADRARSGEGP